MSNDLISVIIPIYNVEKYLHKCICSVLTQTYQNMEIILVDDGSMDSSGIICDEYIKKDRRVKVIHKKNGGLSDARNAGIDVATGEYLCFIDSDDFIHKQYVEILYDILMKNDADIAVCNFQKVQEGEILNERMIDQNDVHVSVLNREESWYALYDSALHYQFTIACSKFYKRRIFKELRFPIGRLNEDAAIAHKVIGEIDRAVYVDEVLYYYLVRSGSIMNSDIKTDDGVKAVEERIEYFRCLNQSLLLEKTYCYYATMIMGVYCRLPDARKYDDIRKSLIVRLKIAYTQHKQIFEKHQKLKIRLNIFLVAPSVYRLVIRTVKRVVK